MFFPLSVEGSYFPTFKGGKYMKIENGPIHLLSLGGIKYFFAYFRGRRRRRKKKMYAFFWRVERIHLSNLEGRRYALFWRAENTYWPTFEGEKYFLASFEGQKVLICQLWREANIWRQNMMVAFTYLPSFGIKMGAAFTHTFPALCPKTILCICVLWLIMFMPLFSHWNRKINNLYFVMVPRFTAPTFII